MLLLEVLGQFFRRVWEVGDASSPSPGPQDLDADVSFAVGQNVP
mgnify:CR=1 FL=1